MLALRRDATEVCFLANHWLWFERLWIEFNNYTSRHLNYISYYSPECYFKHVYTLIKWWSMFTMLVYIYLLPLLFPVFLVHIFTCWCGNIIFYFLLFCSKCRWTMRTSMKV
jgi:hypothetical protein